jgi:hypothetical protein
MQLPFLPYKQLAASLALAVPMLYAISADDGWHRLRIEFLLRAHEAHHSGGHGS